MTNERKQTGKILEEMVKDIGSDAWNLTKRAVKAASKVSLYLATAPIVGMLNENTQRRIYNGNEKLKRGATYFSLLPNMFTYVFLTESLLSNYENLREVVMPYAFILGVCEAGCRWASETLVIKDSEIKLIDYPISITGFFPSLAIDYVFNKYSKAKEKFSGGEIK